jgi:hypothetical protein
MEVKIRVWYRGRNGRRAAACCVSLFVGLCPFLLALALRDYTLNLIESTIGAGTLLDDIAAYFASSARLTSF